MKHTFLTRTAREMQIWRWQEQGLAFAITLAVFTLLGPFETFGLPLHLRLVFWGMCLAAGWLAMVGAMTLVLRHPDLDDWPGPFRVALAVAIATVPILPAVGAIEDWLRPDREKLHAVQFAFNTVLVCGLIASTMYLRVKGRIGRSTTSTPLPPPFFRRLPHKLGRELISFSMQDHYVEVTTTIGSTLILIALGDAIEELGAFPGMRIHRSHWIAEPAFRALVRRDGKPFVQVCDGRELPVSRTYLASAQTLNAPAPPGDMSVLKVSR